MPRELNKLTAEQAENAEYEGENKKIFDGGGLYLHVQESGKYWRIQYRHKGKQNIYSVGTFDNVTLDEARQKRAEVKQMLNEGIDPNKAKKQAKAGQPPGKKRNFISTGQNKTVLFLSDIHLPYHDEEALNLAIQYGLDKNVNHIVLGGDIADFYQVSFWDKRRDRLPFAEEVEIVRNFLRELRETFPHAKITYIKGNHEDRFDRYIRQKAPELFGIKGVLIDELLELDKNEIDFVDNVERITTGGQFFSIGELFFLHGHEIKHGWGSVNVARVKLLKCHNNIIFGHHHCCQEHLEREISGGYKGAWGVGALCNLNPEYMPHNNWVHGFAVISFDQKGNFKVDNRKIIQGEIL